MRSLKNLNPCWKQDGNDFICDLPELPKAIVITLHHRGGYSISERSWFPFTDGVYSIRYANAIDAITDAEIVVLTFIKSFLNATYPVEGIG